MKSAQWMRSVLFVPPSLFLLFAIDVSPGCARGGEFLNTAEASQMSDASTRPLTDATITAEDARSFDTGVVSSTRDSSIMDSSVAYSSVPCVATGAEVCDGLDNNCNGFVDEDFLCKLGDTKGPVCVTHCGTAGQRVCEGPSCDWGVCGPFPENCANTIDDDCNGLVDCADPACVSSLDCASKPDAGTSLTGTSDASCATSVTLAYHGPASPGFIWSEAWWKSSSGVVRVWGKLTECADLIAGDGKLNCSFSVPCGASPFEFQIYLPDKRFWGDTSFDPMGGKGSTIGTLVLSTVKGPLVIKLVPNPSGAPYYNGRVETVL